jgi:hypothetical protein
MVNGNSCRFDCLPFNAKKQLSIFKGNAIAGKED